MQLQTVVWLFYGSFGAVAFSLLSGHLGYVNIGLVCCYLLLLFNYLSLLFILFLILIRIF